MKNLLTSVVVCLLAPVLQAAVSGIVMTPDGTAVAGARVAAYRPLPWSEERALAVTRAEKPALATGTTNESGEFSLDVKVAGIVELLIQREGFAPEAQYVLAGADPAVIELTPAARRTGRVTAGGKPVKNAVVIALQDGAVLWSTATAEDGSYAIAEPPAWTDAIAIVHPDYVPVTLEANSRKLDAELVAGGSVSGTVVRENGRPAAKARVTAGPWISTTSAEDATFVLRHVPADVEKIEAFDGTAFGSAARAANPLVVTAAEGRTITGSVRDAGGRPLPGIMVATLPMRAGTKTFEGTNVAIADEKGSFRLEHLSRGDYAVMAYRVGGLDFNIETISLRDAQTARVDLTPKPEDAITGVVRDEQKRPVAGATVTFTMPQMPLVYVSLTEGTPQARTAADGTFRLALPELPDGTQIAVQAFRQGFAIAASEPVTADRRPVTITLPAGVELTGVVIDAAGKPVAGAGVVVLQDPIGAVPIPMDSALAMGMLKPFVETDAAGKFSLRVNEKVHDLAVWKEGYAGGRAGGIRPGDPLEIVLHAGVEIRGRVTRKAGPPVTEGTVMAASEDATFATAEVEGDGTFTITGLRPGTYMLQYGDGEGAPKTHVRAPAAGVVFELPATGTIVGRAIDASTRKVLTQYDVMADIPGDMELASVDGEESFTMHLPAGPVELDVTASGYVRGTQVAQVEAGKSVEVTIALAPGRAARGTVTDEEGTRVPNATLNVEDGPGFTEVNEHGEFHLDSLPREAVTVTVQANGLVTKKVDLPEGTGDTRFDVVLSRGRNARGRVVTHDGAPVEGATVTAVGDPQQEATTGADGRFTLSGLGGPKYLLYARRDELQSEYVPLEEGKTETVVTMKPSAGAGSIHGVVEGFREGQWMMGWVTAGDSAPAMLGGDGTFRIERIGAGEVELRAYARSTHTEATTAPVIVTVVPNGDVEAKLAFRNDVRVSGTVYEGGVPAPGRKVTFSSDSARWSAVSGETGAYAITGVEPGVLYEVSVEHGGRDFKTRYHVAGPATFDVRIEWARVEGRLVDESGAPVAGAEVELVSDQHDDESETKSDANGAFALSVARVPHVITVSKPGFATATQRVEPSAAPLLIRMQRTGGLHVRITDARTGATLDGYAAAIDANGLQIARTSEAQKDGTMHLPLATGPYRVAVSADGYASQSARVAVPHEGELRFALTPGGTVVVRAGRASSDLVKLILANGEEYVRCHCNGIAEVRLTGLTTTIEHVAPGSYTLQVLDARGLVKTSYPVTVAEGQTVVAELNVPE